MTQVPEAILLRAYLGFPMGFLLGSRSRMQESGDCIPRCSWKFNFQMSVDWVLWSSMEHGAVWLLVLTRVFRARNYLGQSGLTVAFKFAQYVNIVMLLLWEPQPPIYVSWILFRNLLRSCVALLFYLCRLIAMLVPLVCYASYMCWDPLQSFCPALTSIKYPYSFRHVEDDAIID